jgi:hypothetical protein
MPDLKIGDVLGDMCDSGLKIPRKVSENYNLTGYMQINMDNDGADEAVKAILKGVGYENYKHYINKFAVVVAHYPYTAIYSYDYNLSIFTFTEKDDG